MTHLGLLVADSLINVGVYLSDLFAMYTCGVHSRIALDGVLLDMGSLTLREREKFEG